MPKQKLVEFKTKDGLELPGILYGTRKPREAAIFLHGNGSSSVFYHQENKKPLAEALNKKDIALLYFNNRGAHYIKKLSQKQGTLRQAPIGLSSGRRQGKRKLYGMAFEKIKECIFDIDGAIAFLKKQGYRKFYLIGFSTGANKICVYNYYHPKNPVAKYVLLAGGDDAGIYYHLLKKAKFWKILKKAKQKIKKRQGEEIMPELLAFNLIFSYQGFYDIANPDGDYDIFPFLEVIKKLKLSKKPLFRHFKSIKKPTLVVYGEQDEYAWGDVPLVVKILKNYQPGLDYKIIKNANHSFEKHKGQLAKIIADWINV